MSNILCYGQIVAVISCHLHQNPDYARRISGTIHKNNNQTKDSVWMLCADAAQIFDTLDDLLSSDLFIDWHKALDQYAKALLDHLLKGGKPSMTDMLSMACRSIQGSERAIPLH